MERIGCGIKHNRTPSNPLQSLALFLLQNAVRIQHFFLQVEQPLQSFPRIHGKAGVTDVCFHDDQVYSCGRDGQYRVYRFRDPGDPGDGDTSGEGMLEMLEANRVSEETILLMKLEFE